MCTRCVRFMDEVARDSRLTVVERGDRAVIDTFFESGLEGASFAGNVVDICPVGALVSKDFLHKARAWDLDHTPSICPNCSQGCNIDLHTRDNLVQRLKPRENPEVNGHWMCDYGRGRYEWMNRPGDGSSGLRWGVAGNARRPSGRWFWRRSPHGWRPTRPWVALVASPRLSTETLGTLTALALGNRRALAGALSFAAPPKTRILCRAFPCWFAAAISPPMSMAPVCSGYTRTGTDDASGGLRGSGRS